ncbi:lysostaphin resistance A-like protein [Gorillibacterium sp. sgz5001074]|uniref:CPBP family intramembrane glutamic endopeptidase n=1 Tax=Gorillibacterium sp. sgz5001074 TaxID=3446695 RepID=UPI003F668DC2
MKRFRLRDFKLKQVDIHDLDDRLLLINLYLTQGLTLLLGLAIMAWQRQNPLKLLAIPPNITPFLWGAVFAALVLAADLLISRWVPEEMTDDGGVNEMLFGSRPVWHIAVISLVVSLCEELLFRGAVQHAWGPYWTSILFAAIHVRYLRHWLLTGMVFGISYGLGTLYDWSGTLWAPVAAHFIIDLSMGLILRYRRDKP